MLRPTILMDCDGVVADYVGYALDLIPGHGLQHNDIRNDLHTDLPEPHRSTLSSLVGQPGYCANITLYPEAVEYVDALRQIGRVIALTKASNTPHWKSERAAWLQKHLGFAIQDIEIVDHVEDKYAYPGHVLIEDKAETVAQSNHEHRQLLDRPWNRHLSELSGGQRVHSYKDSLAALHRWRSTRHDGWDVVARGK